MFKSHFPTKFISTKNGHHKIEEKPHFISIPDDSENEELLISVIIPTFQEEKILPHLSKIFTSDFKKKYNLEVIVSDGGSSDLTLDIARTFADIIVEHEYPWRQTIAEGRNNGAKVANGRVFVFINADSIPQNPDFFFNFIRRWGNEKGKYSKYKALATYVMSFPDETSLKDRIFYKLHNSYVKLLNLMGFGMGRGECQIIKREIFEIVDGYNPKIAAGEDFELYRRISKIAKIGFAEELKIFESPRRFRKYGYFKVVISWFLNSLSVLFCGKSIAKEWEAVR